MDTKIEMFMQKVLILVGEKLAKKTMVTIKILKIKLKNNETRKHISQKIAEFKINKNC